MYTLYITTEVGHYKLHRHTKDTDVSAASLLFRHILLQQNLFINIGVHSRTPNWPRTAELTKMGNILVTTQVCENPPCCQFTNSNSSSNNNNNNNNNNTMFMFMVGV